MFQLTLAVPTVATAIRKPAEAVDLPFFRLKIEQKDTSRRTLSGTRLSSYVLRRHFSSAAQRQA